MTTAHLAPRTLGVALVGLLVAALAGCVPSPAPPGPGIDDIASVEFRQSQAILDFDDGTYVQDDPAEVAQLVDLFREYDVDPASWQGQDTGCAGNRVTQVTLAYRDSDLATQFSVDSCSDDPFEQDADALFTRWREELAG